MADSRYCTKETRLSAHEEHKWLMINVISLQNEKLTIFEWYYLIKASQKHWQADLKFSLEREQTEGLNPWQDTNTILISLMSPPRHKWAQAAPDSPATTLIMTLLNDLHGTPNSDSSRIAHSFPGTWQTVMGWRTALPDKTQHTPCTQCQAWMEREWVTHAWHTMLITTFLMQCGMGLGREGRGWGLGWGGKGTHMLSSFSSLRVASLSHWIAHFVCAAREAFGIEVYSW